MILFYSIVYYDLHEWFIGVYTLNKNITQDNKNSVKALIDEGKSA